MEEFWFLCLIEVCSIKLLEDWTLLKPVESEMEILMGGFPPPNQQTDTISAFIEVLTPLRIIYSGASD